MVLYLFRHGQTDWNKAHRFQGRIDIPLNDFGRELARVTAQHWPIVKYDRVYCSPLCRAVETAQIVLEGRDEAQQIIIDPRIVEFSFGSNEGQDIDKAGNDPQHPMYNLLHHPEQYVPSEGGETFDEMVSRARSFIDDEILPLEQQGVQNVLIVAHGALIRGIMCALDFKTISGFWDTPYFNCSLTTLNVHDGQFSIVREAEIFYDSTGLFGGWVNK